MEYEWTLEPYKINFMKNPEYLSIYTTLKSNNEKQQHLFFWKI